MMACWLSGIDYVLVFTHRQLRVNSPAAFPRRDYQICHGLSQPTLHLDEDFVLIGTHARAHVLSMIFGSKNEQDLN